MLAFLLVSTLVVFFMLWIFLGADDWTTWTEAFVLALYRAFQYFLVLGAILVIVTVLS